MEAAIKAWINGKQNYAIGVKLYALYGNDDSFKKALVFPETTFRKEQLLVAMEQILTPPPVAPAIVPDNEDPVIKDLVAKAKPLLKERDDFHAKLRLFRTIEERGVAAHRILDLDDQVDSIYNAIRYYKEHRQLPEEKLPFTPITNPDKWEHRYQVCGRYVRRYQDKLDKDPQNAKAKELRAIYEAEQIWLAQKLKKWQ